MGEGESGSADEAAVAAPVSCRASVLNGSAATRGDSSRRSRRVHAACSEEEECMEEGFDLL